MIFNKDIIQMLPTNFGELFKSFIFYFIKFYNIHLMYVYKLTNCFLKMKHEIFDLFKNKGPK